MRLFLAIWLALFAVQTSRVLTVVAADGCIESPTQADDRCPEGCSRCVCCARLVPALPAPIEPDVVEMTGARSHLPVIDSFTTPPPRGVFHVPRPH